MAEKLCQLKKKGGKEWIDIGGAPDVEWESNWVSNNYVKNISVSQLPKIIVGIFIPTDSEGDGMAFCYDVKNGKAYRYGYWGSALHLENFSNIGSYFTSISGSNVTLVNSYGHPCRIIIGIFY